MRLYLSSKWLSCLQESQKETLCVNFKTFNHKVSHHIMPLSCILSQISGALGQARGRVDACSYWDLITICLMTHRLGRRELFPTDLRFLPLSRIRGDILSSVTESQLKLRYSCHGPGKLECRSKDRRRFRQWVTSSEAPGFLTHLGDGVV